MDLDSKKVYLLLGSNLGDRKSIVEQAIEQIYFRIGDIFAVSSLYETAAWGKTDQPDFLNVAVGVNTNLAPMDVLEHALTIEQELGRVRHDKWGSRLIDIDVILYEQLVVDEGVKLQIPHPQMQYRKFVLAPLAEIAGAEIHPILHKSISEILDILEDNLSVAKI